MKSLQSMRTALALISIGLSLAGSAYAQFPAIASNVGNFSGIIQGSTGATDSQLNSGHLILTVQTTGVFSGKLNMSGVVTTTAGAFNVTTGAFSTSMPSTGNGDAFSLTYSSAGTPSVTGTITRYKRSAVVAVLNVTARITYSKLVLPPVAESGIYNVALTAPSAPMTLATGEYPTGNSVGTLTVKSTDGSAKAVIRLADGSVATSATWLRKDNSIVIYAPLAFNLGSLCGMTAVDTGAASTDITGTGLRWFRAQSNSHYYPFGYDTGLTVDLVGAKQSSSTLGSLNLTVASPNATLDITNPRIPASPVLKSLAISGAGVGISTVVGDKSTKYTIIPATSTKSGQITGSYTDIPGGTGKYSIFGIVVAKGSSSQAYGMNISPLPTLVTGRGQGGGAVLTVLP
jgi:hypothetical protein